MHQNLKNPKRINLRHFLKIFTLLTLLIISSTSCGKLLSFLDADEPALPREVLRRSSIKGQVVYASNQPVVSANVKLYPVAADDADLAVGDTAPITLKTDASGQFEFSAVPEGKYCVVAEKDGKRVGVYRIEFNGQETKALGTLKLNPVGIISGVVSMTDQTPTPAVFVRILGSSFRTKTNSDGVFLLSQIPINSDGYTLQFYLLYPNRNRNDKIRQV